MTPYNTLQSLCHGFMVCQKKILIMSRYETQVVFQWTRGFISLRQRSDPGAVREANKKLIRSKSNEGICRDCVRGLTTFWVGRWRRRQKITLGVTDSWH